MVLHGQQLEKQTWTEQTRYILQHPLLSLTLFLHTLPELPSLQ